MKKYLPRTIGLVLITMLMATCNLKEKKISLEGNLDMAVEEAFAEDVMEDVMSNSYSLVFQQEGFNLNKYLNQEGLECLTTKVIKPTDTEWPQITTLDYGEACVDQKGNTRQGRIIISSTGKYKDEGSSRVFSFDNYYINSNKIEGNKMVTTTAREDGILVFSVEENTVIIRSDGVIVNRDVRKTRAWISGEDTPEKWDDVFLINGTVSREDTDGKQVTKIISDLLRLYTCRYPVSGVIETFKDTENPVSILNYGEGECDQYATIITGEGENTEVSIIDLKSKGKSWN